MKMRSKNRKAHGEIENLIYKVQSTNFMSLNQGKEEYTRLLELSLKFRHVYGVALANIYLANYYLLNDYIIQYESCITKAKKIAKDKEYYDILLECYKLEGIHYSNMCDDVAAVSAFFEGAIIADLVKNYLTAAIFYNNIAEFFFESNDNRSAGKYYLKALSLLKGGKDEKSIFYQSYIMINLVNLAYKTKNIKKAKKYLDLVVALHCQKGTLSIYLNIAYVKYYLLIADMDNALSKIQMVLKEIEQLEGGNGIIFPIYMYVMELLVVMKQQDFANWCHDRIKQLLKTANTSDKMKGQKILISYYQTFNIEPVEMYEEFYRVSVEAEKTNQLVNSEWLKNYLLLYQTNKEQENMLKKREDLLVMVDIDELTGLYNRRYYSKLVTKQLHRKDVTILGYIMIDVDYFKEYNDLYGHVQGDVVLQTIGQVLQAHLPIQGAAARYGGDEFSCLLVNTTAKQITDFIMAVQKDLRSHKIVHESNKVSKYISLSFGIVNLANDESLIEKKLLHCADKALYEAKAKGRNTYSFYQE